MEIGRQFNYKEENLMDRIDQKRKDSGVRLHYAPSYPPSIDNHVLHNLYATNGNSRDIIGHVSWNKQTGVVDEMLVHPNWKNSVVASTLIKAANDYQMRNSENGTGLRGSYNTTNEGYRLMQKLDPKHESVVDHTTREGAPKGWGSDEAVVDKLDEMSDPLFGADFQCQDCKGENRSCKSCDGTGWETPKSTSIEKSLKWE